MIQLIVNADDFGLSKGVNYGILEAHKNGIVNSATMLMNGLGTNHAIEMAKEHPSLKVGIHLVVTYGNPLSKNVSSLINQDGRFKSQAQILAANDLDLDELEQEWSSQIDAFLKTGLRPTHIDSHHHIHGLKEFYTVVQYLSDKYQLPVRNISHAFTHILSFSDVFLDTFYGEGVTPDFFRGLADTIEDGRIVEVMCHPGYVDHELLRESSYNIARINETSILTSIHLSGKIKLL